MLPVLRCVALEMVRYVVDHLVSLFGVMLRRFEDALHEHHCHQEGPPIAARMTTENQLLLEQ